MPSPTPRSALAALLAVVATLTGCGAIANEPTAEASPEVGQCRVLTPDDVAAPSNDSEVVDCVEDHTAQTFAAGDLPARFADADHDDRDLARWAYEACASGFREHLGADDSLAMRTVLDWAWFRPSEAAWDDGARWYRCDVVGGSEQSPELVMLPRSTEGLLLGKPKDRWMVCADGPTVTDSVKVPCTQEHSWRAVTTIVLGEADDDYPGDRVSEVRTRDFCSDSVGAWLNYPVTYDFGYTWFHEAEWEAGNRRSVCWAKTPQ